MKAVAGRDDHRLHFPQRHIVQRLALLEQAADRARLTIEQRIFAARRVTFIKYRHQAIIGTALDDFHIAGPYLARSARSCAALASTACQRARSLFARAAIGRRSSNETSTMSASSSAASKVAFRVAISTAKNAALSRSRESSI